MFVFVVIEEDRDESVASSTSSQIQSDWRSEDNSIAAEVMVEDFVKARLKAPGTAKFPGFWDGRRYVTNLGEQKYRIVSYVDAENAFGALIRNRFTGEIEQVEKDRWRLLSLELAE